MQTLEKSSGPITDSTRRFIEESKVQIQAHPGDLRWQLACRIASSGSLGRSRLLSRFLLFIADRHIRGRNHEMTEQQIGILVFDRASGYDSNEDNIVRSYARNLRRRIETYYAAEGQAETLLLDIPRGGYIPAFTPRHVKEPDELNPPVAEPATAIHEVAAETEALKDTSAPTFSPVPAAQWNVRISSQLVWILCVACVVLLFQFHTPEFLRNIGKSPEEAAEKDFGEAFSLPITTHSWCLPMTDW